MLKSICYVSKEEKKDKQEKHWFLLFVLLFCFSFTSIPNILMTSNSKCTSSWYKILVQGPGTRSWYKVLVHGPGTRSWYKVATFGGYLWWLPLMATFGGHLWLLPLMANFGGYLWLLPLVVTFGFPKKFLEKAPP